MKRVAILFSGNMRNVLDIQDNLNDNLIQPLVQNGYEYDIFIHTWDSNVINDTYMSNDKYVKTNDISKIIATLKKNFKVKNVIIENQEDIFNLCGGSTHLNELIGGRDIRGGGKDYTYDLVKKMYFQFYGQYKSYSIVSDDYDYVIKTRPDVWYTERFDLRLFDNILSFPSSHQMGGKNINQIFYVGRFAEMKLILDFWYQLDKNIDTLLKDYIYEKDINPNQIFRHYIINTLDMSPTFVKYNPGIYREEGKITYVR